MARLDYEIGQDELQSMFDDIAFMASKERLWNYGAAVFHASSYDEQVAHFNDQLMPLYRRHQMPTFRTDAWLAFTQTVKDYWRQTKADA